MVDVALKAGVGVASVSRVLSGHPDVSVATRERVLAAVDDLKYTRDPVARSLRSGESRTVGFVVGDISNPLIAQITAGAEETLSAAGYSILLMDSHNDPLLDASHIQLFLKRRVDGMILSLASEKHRPTVQAVRNAKVPVALVDRELPLSTGVSAALSDHRHGLRDAISMLVDNGHRRIGLITGGREIRPGRERMNALDDLLADVSGAEAVYRSGGYSADYGDHATQELIRSSEPPTALVVGGNQLLPGCLRALRRHRLIVGQDVSLITCDEVPLNEFHTPPIAAVIRDVAALGRTAASLLLERILGADEPRQVLLPTSFLPRPSVSKAAPRAEVA